MQLRRWRGLILGLVIVGAADAAVLGLLLWRSGEGAVDLHFCQGDDVAMLDPAKITALSDGRVAGALWEGLTVTDPRTQRPRPGVARSWEISADGLTYTFHLREDARWSDGSAVTAEDFLYSWRRVLDVRTESQYNYMLFPIRGARRYVEAQGEGAKEDMAASGQATRAERIAAARAGLGIEAVSATELRVQLESPTAYFLALTGFQTYLPVKKSCVEPQGDGVEEPRWVFPERLVCNGPYVLKSWVYKSRMRLEKNPHYWNREAVRLRSVEIDPIEALNTALVGYERGALDFVTTMPTLAAEKLWRESRAGRRPDFSVAANLGTYFYRINCSRPPLSDVRVRQALALAVDKQEIVEKAGRCGQPVADVLVPPGIPGYAGPQGLAHDPQRARQLLAEAGFPGGRGFPKLTILYNTNEGHKAIAELVQQAWKRELGIEVLLGNVEWKVMLEKVQRLDYDIARMSWYGDYVDPNTFLDLFVTGGGNNETGWSNAEYDRLIAAAGREADAGKRMAMMGRAEKILVEEGLPIIPFYHYVGTALVRGTVHGYEPNLLNEILFQDLWTEKTGGPGAED